MAQIVFFIAVAIAMLIVLGNSFQMKYQENIERRQSNAKGAVQRTSEIYFETTKK